MRIKPEETNREKIIIALNNLNVPLFPLQFSVQFLPFYYFQLPFIPSTPTSAHLESLLFPPSYLISIPCKPLPSFYMGCKNTALRNTDSQFEYKIVFPYL